MDAVYTALTLTIMQCNRMMNLELCDVPSAYLNTPLPKGKKHLMRIKPSIAKYFVIADPPRRNSCRKTVHSLCNSRRRCTDSQKLVSSIWHELLRDNLTACGYKHRPNDTTTWKRVERKDGKTAAVSIILVFVDDFMHIWKTYAGSDTSSMQT
jgi:hypothetical protein